MTKYVNFGAILKSKEGSLYIKLDEDIKLSINGEEYNNQFISLNKPSRKYKNMAAKGKLSEAEAEEKISNIPDYIRYELTATFKES